MWIVSLSPSGRALLVATTAYLLTLAYSFVPMNHPQQNRTNVTFFNPNNRANKEQFDYLIQFAEYNKHRFLDFGQPCSVEDEEKWVRGNMSIISGEPETSYAHSTEWYDKLCNFFQYLECHPENKTCACPSDREKSIARWGIELIQDGENDVPARDEDELKKRIKRKRRCRVPIFELCSYIRIPPKAFPGVEIDVPDFFECQVGEDISCEVNVTRDHDGRRILSERCINHTNHPHETQQTRRRGGNSTAAGTPLYHSDHPFAPFLTVGLLWATTKGLIALSLV